MKQLYVNAIYEENGIPIGVIVLDKTFWKSAPTFFDEKKLAGFKMLDSAGDDFYLIFRCCQYVVYCQKNNLGITAKVYDFKGDFDKGLEEYTSLKNAGWGKPDRDRILGILHDIHKNPQEPCEMIIQDPVPLP
jgi:hypothetical protein